MGCIGLNLRTKKLELSASPVREPASQNGVSRSANEVLVEVEVVLAQKPVREDLASKIKMPDIAPGKACQAYGTPAGWVEWQGVRPVPGVLYYEAPRSHKSLSVPSVAGG